MPSGRWAVRPCAAAASLPLACRAAGDDTAWALAPPGAACAAGWLARPPTNGFANNWLWRAAAEELSTRTSSLRPAAVANDADAAVLLNVSVDGRAASPLLRGAVRAEVRLVEALWA